MAKIPINIATGSLQKEEIIVGIDLGTTNSLIAIIHPDTGKPVALKEHDSSSLVPSIIYFDQNGTITVGEAAREFLVTEPQRTIFSSKRLMGKSFNDLQQDASQFSYRIIDQGSDSLVKIQVDDKYYSPVDLASFILKELRQRAEHILKTSVNKVVITVPAYFNDAQRQATRDAGKLAGLDVLRIINEPTAASLAYGVGLHKEDNAVVAVYDLGGGTFDISILRISEGIFEVLSTNGDTHLGGDDFDRLIAEKWQKEFESISGHSSSDESMTQQLRLHAEEAKKHLSAHDSYDASLNNHQLRLTKAEFETLAAPLISRTIESCRRALKDATLHVNDIDTILMVGGSTRMPMVKDAVRRFFEKEVNESVNPDEIVAHGAALQADILAGNNKEFLLLDITPLSLGIETSGGLMDVLIPRNAKIPSGASRQYTTQVDGQSGMRISVYQGERDLIRDNRKLAEFNLSGIPPMPAGLPKVEVRFLINADGILTVSAKELRSGIEQVTEIKPQYGLTDEAVEEMLQDSITNATSDIAARALTEARTEAEQLLHTTEKFLQKNSALLSREELMNTANAMQALQLATTLEDKNLIHAKIEELNDFSRPYAERIMNTAIADAMKGTTV